MLLRQLDIGIKKYILNHGVIKNKTGIRSSLASFLKFVFFSFLVGLIILILRVALRSNLDYVCEMLSIVPGT